MPIDVTLFKTEITYVAEGLERAMDLGKQGHHDEAIRSLTDVIISAGRLLQRDEGVGRALRLDRTILVAKGFQLKAHIMKLDAEPEHADEIAARMYEIAKGDLSVDNPHMAEIMSALSEWKDTSERGDFYTRPRKDG